MNFAHVVSWQVSLLTAFKVTNSLQLSDISTTGHTTARHFPAHHSKGTNFPLTVTHSYQRSQHCHVHSCTLLSKYFIPFNCHTSVPVNIPLLNVILHIILKTPPLPSVAMTMSNAFWHTTLKVHSSLQLSNSPICLHTRATYIPTHQSKYMQFLSTVIHCYRWPYHLQTHSCKPLSECTVPLCFQSVSLLSAHCNMNPYKRLLLTVLVHKRSKAAKAQ
jgi:hypothetical protein